MTDLAESRKQERIRRNKRRRPSKRKNLWKPAYWWVLGAVIVVGALSWLAQPSQVQTDSSILDFDIVYGEPITAIHEMGGPELASIAFLPEDEPQPQIAVSELVFDFGSVGLTEIVQHTFVLANQGESPLSISRAYTTCGCTTAELTASEIPPGKSIYVSLTFDAGFHDTGGQTVKRGVVIESNDPNTPEFTFWTEAKVRTTP